MLTRRKRNNARVTRQSTWDGSLSSRRSTLAPSSGEVLCDFVVIRAKAVQSGILNLWRQIRSRMVFRRCRINPHPLLVHKLPTSYPLFSTDHYVIYRTLR